jgi:hypothetical protein
MPKFILSKSKNTNEYWNGKSSLPDEINVLSYHPIISEFELLSLICGLHGYLTAFDILTGADSETEKDKDINAVMTAFQMYLYPKMPLSNYSSSDKRITPNEQFSKIKPIDAKI